MRTHCVLVQFCADVLLRWLLYRRVFPADVATDLTVEERIAEMIREYIFKYLNKVTAIPLLWHPKASRVACCRRCRTSSPKRLDSSTVRRTAP